MTITDLRSFLSRATLMGVVPGMAVEQARACWGPERNHRPQRRNREEILGWGDRDVFAKNGVVVGVSAAFSGEIGPSDLIGLAAEAGLTLGTLPAFHAEDSVYLATADGMHFAFGSDGLLSRVGLWNRKEKVTAL